MKNTKTVITAFGDRDHLKIKLFCAVRLITISQLVRTAVMEYIDAKMTAMSVEKRAIIDQRMQESAGTGE